MVEFSLLDDVEMEVLIYINQDLYFFGVNSVYFRDFLETYFRVIFLFSFKVMQ